ncbi:hypothetical protein K0M31_001580 [Melipona bicolor]|uniref:Uncharacterized protein n=1 Tax=Melipona bicolor TaxID=60889 RepID=A0AA40GFV7_9HYME|nr:hypothetical protein K0M31_001580 [Melipona bicolor]
MNDNRFKLTDYGLSWCVGVEGIREYDSPWSKDFELNLQYLSRTSWLNGDDAIYPACHPLVRRTTYEVLAKVGGTRGSFGSTQQSLDIEQPSIGRTKLYISSKRGFDGQIY